MSLKPDHSCRLQPCTHRDSFSFSLGGLICVPNLTCLHPALPLLQICVSSRVFLCINGPCVGLRPHLGESEVLLPSMRPSATQPPSPRLPPSHSLPTQLTFRQLIHHRSKPEPALALSMTMTSTWMALQLPVSSPLPLILPEPQNLP